MKNKKFLADLEEQLVNHIGIVTPILRSKELEEIAGGEKKIGKIFLKRTDLHHDSSHKPVSAFSSVFFAKHILKAKKITILNFKSDFLKPNALSKFQININNTFPP